MVMTSRILMSNMFSYQHMHQSMELYDAELRYRICFLKNVSEIKYLQISYVTPLLEK